MLDALMSGRALAAGELARVAGIGGPAASEHLGRLSRGGLVEVVAQGRHRYYRLAGPDVGAALEALSHIAPAKRVTTLRQSGNARSLAFARTCYDHLAGTCGVALHDAAVRRDWIVAGPHGYDVTGPGARVLHDLGVDVEVARAERRALARPCLDWTERRPHLAGAIGARLCDRFLELGWLVRRSSETRALRVTDAGRAGFAELGCRLEQPSAPR